MRVRPLLLLSLVCCGSRAPAAPSRASVLWPPDAKEAIARGDLASAARAASRLDAEGNTAAALAVRVEIAGRSHDRGALEELLGHPALARLREEPSERARLANALATTVGLSAARPDLDAVCRTTALPETSRIRVDACSLAALAAVANGREPTLAGGPSVTLPLLPKLPIPIVMLSVNGLPAEPFIVDTGAAGIALSKAYCDAHGISYLKDAPRVTHDGGGAEVPLFPAWIDSLDARGMRVSNIEAVVIALPPNLRVGGIVAPHRAFAGALVELDLRAEELRIQRDVTEDAWTRATGETVHRVPLTWDDGNVLVRAELGDRVSGFMNFDTGAAASVVTLETAAKLGHAVDRARATESVSIAPHASFPAFETTMALAAEPTERVSVVPIERKKREGLDGPGVERLGNVGMTWMKGRRLAIAANGRTLLYTDASEPSSAEARP